MLRGTIDKDRYWDGGRGILESYPFLSFVHIAQKAEIIDFSNDLTAIKKP